mmetsp:Transcript_72830/g.189606  ORF Transcript_72830/g.189606 Transcript_72830/m.189606 type:complete len:700 (+) Transcript_72830:55-2154(+)
MVSGDAVKMLPAVGVAALSVGAAFWLQLISVGFIALLGGLCAAGLALGQRAVLFLGKDEQLLVEGFTGTTVINGPGTKVLNPFSYRSAETRKAVTLSATDYAKITDLVDGSERVEKGPQLLFLGPYDKVTKQENALSLSTTEYAYVQDQLTGSLTIVKGPCMWFPSPYDSFSRGQATSLSKTEFIIVEDQMTAEKKTVKGPCVWFPGPNEKKISQHSASALQEDQYLRLKDTSSGARWIQKGKALVFLEPTWAVEATVPGKGSVRSAWSLKAYEYVRLVDSITGKITVHRGEKTVFPGPDEELLDGEVLTAMDLKVHEYVKILDQATGDIRVESGTSKGSKQVFLGPYEKCIDGGQKKAIEVDEDHAVLVRDKATGQLRLVTENQLFVPAANETIEEVRSLIRLADHEAMIVKGNDGEFQYFYGSEEKRKEGQPRSFFLQPYDEIVKLCWSKGRRRETRNLFIERFDCRPQFMSFEFNCRTSDNVELVLEGTFFWEVVNLPAMVKSTGDTTGDLCNHARSQFIRHVARVTLKEFMETSHTIAKAVWEDDKQFYASRGVWIHSLEVTRYACADSRTSEILEQIIQETTNRMNRLSQAESENEVNLFRMQGQIEQERLNGDLLKIQHEHSTEEAEVMGKAESARIAAFMDGLQTSVPKPEDRAHMWQVLRKTEALATVTQGNCTLYFTPSDVDLSIETKAR